MAIKITACTITKNEEKNMPGWLACMQEVADEIIVVDTGSTDATVDIAQKAVGKVYHFKWINDFSAAKNYAIEQATGDWILFLDADETFTPAARKVLRHELERFDKDKSVGCLLCRMLDIDTDNDNRIFNTGMLPRVFRHTPYIRYAGAIHEQVENSRGNMKMVFAEKLEFYHTGYSRSIVRSKSERNLPIMLAELEKATTDKERRKLYPYLLDAYNTLNDYEKVLYYARKCISTGRSMVGAPGHFYEVMVMAMYNAGEPLDELLSTLDEAEKSFNDDPFFPFVRSMVWEREGDLIESEKTALQGLALRQVIEEKMAQGVGVPDTARGFVPYVYERLGKISAIKKKYKQAADYYLKALKYHKYQKDSLQGLCRLLPGIDDVELIELLNSIYDRDIDGNYLVNALKGCVSKGVLAYYGKNVKGFNEAYLFMAGRRYDSAGMKLGQRYKELAQLGILGAENMVVPPQDGYLDILVGSEYKNSLMGKKSRDARILKRLKDYRIRTKLDGISFPEEDIPKVSIMIPTYNRPELFERTLMSAINQTYPNVEILVNDNSTNDATEKLMEKYAGVVNLHYYRNTEAKSKAENFAPFKTIAQGQYLQWCMDDDLLAKDKLTKMVPVLRNNKEITLVSSIRGIINENDDVIEGEGVNLMPIPEGKDYGYYYGEDMARQMLITSNNLLGEPSAVLFRRQDLTHHYWQAEAKGYKTISDVAMWCELLEKGHCIVFKQPLSYYRRHGNQEGQMGEIVLLSRLEWMQLITSYYERKLFIKEQADYKEALMVLYNEYEQSYGKNDYLQQMDNFSAYREAMELITRLV